MGDLLNATVTIRLDDEDLLKVGGVVFGSVFVAMLLALYLTKSKL